MRWATEEWDACPAMVIKNCFNHCLKEGVANSEVGRGVDEVGVVDSMVRNAMEHGATFTRAGLINLFRPDSEDAVTETVTLQELDEEVAGIEPAGDSDEGDDLDE